MKKAKQNKNDDKTEKSKWNNIDIAQWNAFDEASFLIWESKWCFRSSCWKTIILWQKFGFETEMFATEWREFH